jgi:hypothetical protein
MIMSQTYKSQHQEPKGQTMISPHHPSLALAHQTIRKQIRVMAWTTTVNARATSPSGALMNHCDGWIVVPKVIKAADGPAKI